MARPGSDRSDRRPTMADVAALAGVSHQTVSRVLNEHPSVRPLTRQVVRSAMEQLGYRPNLAAKALVQGRTSVLGLISPQSTLYGPSSTRAAFEREAGARGYAVFSTAVPDLDANAAARAVERLLEQQIYGLAVHAPTSAVDGLLSQLPDGMPVVLLDAPPSPSLPGVTVDQALGARLATEHLLALGHKTVWHISGPLDWFDGAQRSGGWRAALHDAGVLAPPVLTGDWSAAAGYEAGRLLAEMPHATAVFCANDTTALGAIRALVEAGRKVPEDVSVVGFDDVPDAPYYLPPLTTVRQDFEDLARAAVRTLLDGRGTASTSPPRVEVPPRLVVRASTTAAP